MYTFRKSLTRLVCLNKYCFVPLCGNNFQFPTLYTGKWIYVPPRISDLELETTSQVEIYVMTYISQSYTAKKRNPGNAIEIGTFKRDSGLKILRFSYNQVKFIANN